MQNINGKTGIYLHVFCLKSLLETMDPAYGEGCMRNEFKYFGSI